MRLEIVVLTFFLASCAATPTNFGDKFDVQGGSYTTYIDKPIIEEGFLRCHIVARSTSSDPDWAPSVLLTIQGNDEDISSQVVYYPVDNFHDFYFHIIENEKYSYSNQFLRLKRSSEDVFLTIFWEDSGNISFSAGDSLGQYATGYIYNPDQFHSKIIATVSGVKGEISCSGEGI